MKILLPLLICLNIVVFYCYQRVNIFAGASPLRSRVNSVHFKGAFLDHRETYNTKSTCVNWDCLLKMISTPWNKDIFSYTRISHNDVYIIHEILVTISNAIFLFSIRFWHYFIVGICFILQDADMIFNHAHLAIFRGTCTELARICHENIQPSLEFQLGRLLFCHVRMYHLTFLLSIILNFNTNSRSR